MEDDADADPLAEKPLLHCWGSCAALKGHHRSEGTVLIPRLAEDPKSPVLESHFRYEERQLLDVLDGMRDETPTPRELLGQPA